MKGSLAGERSSGVLGAQAAGHPLPLAERPEALEALHQDGVVGDGVRHVDDLVQELVVAGGRHVQGFLDGTLLGAGVLPPEALELEDLPFPLAKVRPLTLLAVHHVPDLLGASLASSNLRLTRMYLRLSLVMQGRL